MLTSCLAFAFLNDPAYRYARLHGANAKIGLHINDEHGVAVSNAQVCAFLGMNFREKGRWIKGFTNALGMFVIEGKTCGDEIELDISKDGYYNSCKKLCIPVWCCRILSNLIQRFRFFFGTHMNSKLCLVQINANKKCHDDLRLILSRKV